MVKLFSQKNIFDFCYNSTLVRSQSITMIFLGSIQRGIPYTKHYKIKSKIDFQNGNFLASFELEIWLCDGRLREIVKKWIKNICFEKIILPWFLSRKVTWNNDICEKIIGRNSEKSLLPHKIFPKATPVAVIIFFYIRCYHFVHQIQWYRSFGSTPVTLGECSLLV